MLLVGNVKPETVCGDCWKMKNRGLKTDPGDQVASCQPLP